jgi:hypothetical protein
VKGDRYGTILIDEATIIATNVDGAFYRSPRIVTSRRIRRNALRELKRRLRWGHGKSYAEAIRTIDVDRVAMDRLVGEHELALLAAVKGGAL